jgi:hypothetical protein
MGSKDKPIITVADPLEELKTRYDRQTNIIIGVLVVAMLTSLMMVGGILLEAWHFNSAVYKEYSEKMSDASYSRETTDAAMVELKQAQTANALLMAQNQKLLEDMAALTRKQP